MQCDTLFYAAKNLNMEILTKSSSGGVFDALSRTIIEKGGAVVGASFSDDKKTVRYVMCTKEEELCKLYGSKYIQADPEDVLEQITRYIAHSECSTPLLISGTPCHVEGIRRYLNSLNIELKNVYYCSLICHGVPSPKIWKEYIDLYFPKDKLEKVSFKDKRHGWEKPVAVAVAKGKEYSLVKYTHLFNNDLLLRPSCYKCKFSTTKRTCDITIGDYWGVDKRCPEFYDKKGVSLILIHSNNGNKLLKEASKYLELKRITEEMALQPNLVRPSHKPAGRELFWKYYSKYGLKRVIWFNEIGFIFLKIRLKVKKILRLNQIKK